MNIRNTINNYIALSRLDKPIGYLLLWIPITWGACTSLYVKETPLMDIVYICSITFIGAITMRGAGCTWNDIVDRDFDKKVKRTQNRPLANNSISLPHAYIYCIFQIIISGIVWLNISTQAQIASIIAIIPAIIYPFMKRFTYWPQAWLGLTFNWGIWVGWLSFTDTALYIPLLLHIGAVFWTIGYDTIYAHQDCTDDIKIGVKSSALYLQHHTHKALVLLYSLFILSLIIIGQIAHLSWAFYTALSIPTASLMYQIRTLDINNTDVCLHLFKHNRITGLCITFAIIVGYAL